MKNQMEEKVTNNGHLGFSKQYIQYTLVARDVLGILSIEIDFWPIGETWKNSDVGIMTRITNNRENVNFSKIEQS